MDQNVQNFMKNFVERQKRGTNPDESATCEVSHSQNPSVMANTPSTTIYPPLDLANTWNTWSSYAGGESCLNEKSSALVGSASGTVSNGKVNANDGLPRSNLDDLLDLRLEEVASPRTIPDAIFDVQKEPPATGNLNLAVGTPVDISNLLIDASEVATKALKDEPAHTKVVVNSSAPRDIVCALKDTMKASTDMKGSMDSMNSPHHLSNALKDIMKVHREIAAQNNEASNVANKLPNTTSQMKSQTTQIKDVSENKPGAQNIPEKKTQKITSPQKLMASNECDLDRKLKCDFEEKKFNSKYQEFQKIREALPIYHKKDTIVDLIEKSKVVVISGSTGCGKTTQVAQYILDTEIVKGRGSSCRIVCTQPRRISAVSVAERIAEERCEVLGEDECSVGYQVRLEKKLPRVYGSILFCTPGILLQNMHNDPEIEGISHLLMDEIHERDVTSDFFMALMKELTIKRNLKVVLMSATMDSDIFSKYFNDCPMLDIAGVPFPVQEYFLEDILTVIKPSSINLDTAKNMKRKGPSLGRSNNQFQKNKTDYMHMMNPYIESLIRSKKYPNHVIQQLKEFKIEFLSVDNIFALIKYICFEKRQPGAILVFLPGWENICSLVNMMDESGLFPEEEFLIIHLHSSVSIQQQQMAFITPEEGVRKIVISTNIAETSITIDDIVFVIDCGLCKLQRFDARKKIKTLETEFISKANLLQRRGRAGRLQKGECYHFITKERKKHLRDQPEPEIQRTSIEEIIIKCKLLPLGKTQDFLEKLLNPPAADITKASIDILMEAQVLDADEELTPLGRLIAFLPVDHFLGKMIIFGTFFRCLDPILSIASSLSLKDPFVLQLKKRKQFEEKKVELDQKRYSDHILVSEVMRMWGEAWLDNKTQDFCEKNFVSHSTLEYLSLVKQQLADSLHELKFIADSSSLNYLDENLNVNSKNIAVIRAVICAALYPNFANVKDEMMNFRDMRLPVLETFEDKQVNLGMRSVNSKVQFFPSKFLVYFSKQCSANKVYLNDTTMVSLSSLVLFANRVQCNFQPYVIIKNIPYDMSRNRGILNLREKFIKAFRDFTENPRFIPIDSREEHNIVLQEIVDLLTKEENLMK